MEERIIIVDTEENACMLRVSLGGLTKYHRIICEGFCGYKLDEIKKEADKMGIKYTEGTTERIPAY